MRAKLQQGILFGLLSSSVVATASGMQLASLDSLAELSLEDLMNIQVVSVSRRAEPLRDSAAAVFVLSGEDIRRSGVRSLAEALRLIPGLQVARVDSHSWAITARGINSTLADKLEVLMDGRSLYTPLFSGVFWENQDTVLKDIERIEVIRGPGAALWGANAVNGVVNIVTRSAADTLGGHQTLGAGGEYEAFGELRYGAKIGEQGYYRVYGKGQWYDEQRARDGGGSGDDWSHRQAGFRADVTLGDRQNLTVQGDVYRGNISAEGVDKEESRSGENVILRFRQDHSEHADTDWQLVYDRSQFNNQVTFAEERQWLDFELKHHRRLGDRQEIVVGGGFRLSRDDIAIVDPQTLDFIPRSRRDETYDLFLQDQIDFLESRLRLTLGAKLEHNDYSGSEFQPSIRARYKIDEDTTVWGALSRAVRIPNRLDEDLVVFSGVLRGNRDFDSERLYATELGYRKQFSETFSVDLALFYNEYDRLRGLTDNLAAPQSLPVLIDNVGAGRSHGAELSSHWQWQSNIKWLLSYRYFDLDIKADADSRDQTIADANANDPSHQLKARLDWDISEHWALFVAARWVGELKDQNVDAYAAVDANVMWQLSDQLEVSLRASNLTDDAHPEFGQDTEIRRSVHAQLTWTF